MVDTRMGFSMLSETTGDRSYYKPEGQSFVQYLSSSRGKEAEEKAEWKKKNTKFSELAEKLQVVGCPYLEGMDEAVVCEVIMSPGEARMRVLTWLTGRIHPNHQAVLMEGTSTVSTAPKLASLLHDAGLCLPEDHELVKGTTPAFRQLQFLDALLELVGMAAWVEKATAHSEDTAAAEDSVSGVTDRVQSIPLSMERCCHFVDDLCRHEDLKEIFPSSLSLIPPGISVASESAGIPSCLIGKDRNSNLTTPPQLSLLLDRCYELRSLLEEKQVELVDTMKKCPDSLDEGAQLKPEVVESCHKKLAVSLTTLAQLAVSFCQIYDTEIQPWTNRKAPPPNTLGPLCRKVDHLKTELDKLFEALKTVEASFLKLEEMNSPTGHWNKDEIGAAAHQTLKECLSALTSNS